MNNDFILPQIPVNPFEAIDVSIFKEEITQSLINIFEKVKKKLKIFFFNKNRLKMKKKGMKKSK